MWLRYKLDFNGNFHRIFDADWLWCLVATCVTLPLKANLPLMVSSMQQGPAFLCVKLPYIALMGDGFMWRCDRTISLHSKINAQCYRIQLGNPLTIEFLESSWYEYIHRRNFEEQPPCLELMSTASYRKKDDAIIQEEQHSNDNNILCNGNLTEAKHEWMKKKNRTPKNVTLIDLKTTKQQQELSFSILKQKRKSLIQFLTGKKNVHSPVDYFFYCLPEFY